MPRKTLEELVAEAKANVGHISADELTESGTESVVVYRCPRRTGLR